LESSNLLRSFSALSRAFSARIERPESEIANAPSIVAHAQGDRFLDDDFGIHTRGSPSRAKIPSSTILLLQIIKRSFSSKQSRLEHQALWSCGWARDL
jgi:hypothetical protein